MEEKEYVINEIKALIETNNNSVTEINPKLLDYFTLEELYDIKDNLIRKKEEFQATTKEYVEEIYEKTKKVEI